ncbi:hypothetical protein [Labedaea rhizosphaerae]|uniref:hypothetical protein n=1 Tax=Labedaea rhizosphaerae TaxID=598644 RepID=UPI00105C040E|nr:hypothetical protein [Labedaea rhizosphaerae]
MYNPLFLLDDRQLAERRRLLEQIAAGLKPDEASAMQIRIESMLGADDKPYWTFMYRASYLFALRSWDADVVDVICVTTPTMAHAMRRTPASPDPEWCAEGRPQRTFWKLLALTAPRRSDGTIAQPKRLS